MSTLLETRATTAPAASTPAGAPSRWVEVVSHIDPRYGGLSAAVPQLAEHLGHLNFDVDVAAFCAPQEHFQPAALTSAQLSYWPASRRPWLQSALTPSSNTLGAAFRTQLRHANGVHIHGLWEQSTMTAAAAARALRIPYIVSAHGMLEPWALAAKRRKKQIYAALIERNNVARAACLHALTLAEAQHYINFGARAPIAVIPNGIALPAHTSPDEFLTRFPHLRNRRIVLFLARLHPKKGLDLLIDAWGKVSPAFPEAQLVIAGADFENTRAAIEAEAVTRGVARSVTFTGMLAGSLKWSALAAAEGFVLPSRSEGLSVSVLEAMGMGLPVIVTEPCNMPEVLERRAGWQIQPDAAQLTSALAKLLDNTLQRNSQIGARGAELVRSRFSWSTVAAQMAELYHWVEGGPAPTTIRMVHP